ncbi:DNA-directed RNA polymerase subunit B'' [Candidatus Woesearchaeota archaeon]|jgi:DNA-directed RNA polymerase subunit B|nr:DNA-directed RNA polymerase subunit B'' [Candidatus Woesearchaeota archaeon]MBT4150395.1 DNA-directed RNA polymerase subunit B'' [Candidatus Woesearchaeota archaeon]MBT4247395.1 DNA-directed RNA polymerase subunit B'' [Candidatus Woesearchaeota archaeon]MBT4434550.1 DNA-directed RNA polymerase subunit B'' [Candidatus Woesearchaeota archaeon]MBT7331991.1 DNA-directed RNA polymerase subunit B'' [Candidatus Woesearchaeota archaeon]
MDRSILVKKYFEEKRFVDSSIQSFNTLLDKGLQIVIEENKEAEPTIIPHNIERFKIRFGRITVGKPEITEADGSKRAIYPMESRLRKISYTAPIFLEVSTYINDVQRENFVAEVGKLPIMLKSKYCNLDSLSREELIKRGEDPTDPGGYFIVNGTERVIVNVEDLAGNNFVVEKTKTGDFSGRFFSAAGSYKIPHTFERKKDGIFYMSFTRVKQMPIVVVLKAIGLLKDEEIMKAISTEKTYDEVILNLFEFVDVKTQDDAIDYIAKRIGIAQAKEIRMERTKDILDKFLLPNMGAGDKMREAKARNICKMLKKFIDVSNGQQNSDDKDHYMNKRLRMSGDLLLDLFRANFKVLVGDILYNFQRIIKRGKLPSVRVIIRDKLLTSRLYSAMATGEWVGGRQGVSQRISRINFLDMVSHLQRVVSPLSSSQENFDARALHCTHIGRLCPIETPEGTNIGLRKNLAMLCSLSQNTDEKEVLDAIKSLGLQEAQ